VEAEVRRLGWRDLALPAALLVVGALELASLRTEGWVASIGLEALSAIVLVFRRTHTILMPLAAVPLFVIPLTGTQMDEAAAPIFFYILAIYSLGRYLSLRGGLIAVVVTLGLVFADFRFDADDNDWTDLVFILSLAVPPYVFGRISRKLSEQATLLAQQQEQIRDQATRDERDRIARELHDVIAHSVSAMVVQTAAAQELLATDPDRAAQLLETVASTGREALAETGRLLHLIRDDSDELGLRPAPGLSDLPELVDGFRERGLAVDAHLALPVDPLPGGIDVSAYRLVQEALTNALKHGSGSVDLTVDTDGDQLRIACANALAAHPGHGSGLGLQGMAERVGLLGGRLAYGPNGDGRFHVEATIPLPAEATT
jgi:signal transduction histidine kinase